MLPFGFTAIAANCFQTIPNKAIQGIWDITVSGGVDVCVATCKSMSNCTAISYSTEFSQTCTLWRKVDAIVDVDNVIILAKNISNDACTMNKSNSSCTNCTYSSTTAITSNHTAFKSVNNETECANACNEMTLCKGYTLQQGSFQMGCSMLLNTEKSINNLNTVFYKHACSCPNNATTMIETPPMPTISQMDILGLTLVAIFGIVALSGVIYVILYSYKPMKKSIPRWHTSTHSPTTPVNNAFSDPYPLKPQQEKHDSIGELRSLNLIDFNQENGGKQSFRLSLPAGYVKLSDYDGNTCTE